MDTRTSQATQGDHLENIVDEVRDDVQEFYKNTAARFSEELTAFSKTADEMAASLREKVMARPLAYAIGALAAGVLVSVAFQAWQSGRHQGRELHS